MAELTQEQFYARKHWEKHLLKAGDVVWANLNDKVRPVVIAQNAHTTFRSDMIMVIPLTRSEAKVADNVHPVLPEGVLEKGAPSALLTEQLQPVAKVDISTDLSDYTSGEKYDYKNTLFPAVKQSLLSLILPD